MFMISLNFFLSFSFIIKIYQFICWRLFFKLYLLLKYENNDFSFKKAFTDYLDDISTRYYDKEAINDHSGDVAKQLSSRASADVSSSAESGSIRENPNFNDNYFFIGFKLSSPFQTI